MVLLIFKKFGVKMNVKILKLIEMRDHKTNQLYYNPSSFLTQDKNKWIQKCNIHGINSLIQVIEYKLE